MSRIGKKVIEIPAKTEVTVSGSTVSVKGPKGTLEKTIGENVTVKVENNTVVLTPHTDSLENVALWGTYASHIVNMVKGVNETFTKKLILEGIGYKADVKGNDLVLALGFSHPVVRPIPSTLKVTSDKGIVTIIGVNKDEVGQFAAEIRALKKPEPYKGKGFRYDDEVIRRKQGKKAA
jgi:large subunit ribosomal protein L6